jgi:hypothetical protein
VALHPHRGRATAMTDSDDHRFFFIHVMKTAGWSFRFQLRSRYRRGQVYPDPKLDDDMQVAYSSIPYLLELPEQRRRAIRAYSGHFPSIAVELLDPTLTTITLLREPVDRTVSYLKHCTRYHPQHKGMPLEQIYEDQFVFQFFIRDFQTKMFSMREGDKLVNCLEVIEIDQTRLDLAKHNIEQVDVLGLTEHFDEFIASVHDRFGWGEHKPAREANVSKGDFDVPDQLIERIRQDNAADIELYEHARRLYERGRSNMTPSAGAPT